MSARARRYGAVLAFGSGLALTAAARPAAADPTWNAGWETGVCSSGAQTLALLPLGWCNALHADLLFLRRQSRDLGLGPSLRLGTARFDDLRLDAGLSLLLPVFESFPVVIDAGPHLRNFREPGLFGSVFFGVRSFNHYGAYEMAAGLSLTAERTFGSDPRSSLWLTARIDGSWLALPWIFTYNALR